MPNSPDRARFIRLVHVAKRELRLDDDAYRAILQSVIGKKSTSDMQVFELKQLVEHLKKCGFTVKTTKKPTIKKDIQQDQHQQSLKIRALWLSLATMGIIRDPSEAALGKWIKRETDVDALAWLSGPQASSCIEKLKKWNQRIVRTRAQAFCKAWDMPFIGITTELRDCVFKMAMKHLGRGAALDTLTKEHCAILMAKRLEVDHA